MDEVGPVCISAQQKMIEVAESCLLVSPAYQKEMGMQILHSHEAIINIYNKHLGSSDWADNNVAILHKLHLTNKPSGSRLYMKSACTSQDVASIQAQVTPSGKRHRLDPEDDLEILSMVSGLHDLVLFSQ
jgi:hypothetical protein